MTVPTEIIEKVVDPRAYADGSIYDAYRWLRQHAGQFGFVESYPRDNKFGVIAEPWHWCHHPAVGAASRTGRA